jgi:hypothetical protein
LTPDLNSVLEAALEIARSRKQILVELRGALERGDDEQALQIARRLAGLEPRAGSEKAA